MSTAADDILADYSLEQAITDELAGLIRDGHAQAPRSQQKAIGVSEIGAPCPRQLAMKIAGFPQRQRYDPLPSVIGTATHALLERYATEANAAEAEAGRPARFVTEAQVDVCGVPGHADLYIPAKRTVVDWKVLGNTSYDKVTKRDMGSQYRAQLHLYGMGFTRAGLPVDYVALAVLPKTGNLTGLAVITEAYDPALAQHFLDRWWALIEIADELAIESHPQRVAMIPTDPDAVCVMCPFFSPTDSQPGRTCPGHKE